MTKDIRAGLHAAAAKGGKYFKGTARLFLASGSEFVGNQLPTVGAMVETNRELLQDTAKFLRNPVDTVNRTINKAMGTEDFKALQKFAKNMVADLRSGDLYDPDRMRSSFGETIDGLLDDFGDFDMSGFDAQGEWQEPDDSGDFEKDAALAESQEKAADTRTSATIEAIGLGTDAVVNTANANAQTNIRLSLKQHSQLMAGMQNMVTQQAATLQAVNQTAVSILDVSREAHQQVMAGINGISTILQRIEQNTAPVKPERATAREELEIIGPNGELNITNWLKQVKKNADDKYNISSMMTMATGGMSISSLLEQVGDNPWQLVSDALLQRMLPPSLKKQFEVTGKKLEGFFPALLSKMNDRGKKYGSGESTKITDFLAGLFGHEERSKRAVDTSVREPSAQAVFSNRTATAVEQVIPMWLSKIYTALTGEDEKIFDYGAGKFTRVVDVLAKTSNDVNDLANRMGTAAGNFIDLAKSVKFEKVEDEEDFHKYLYKYLQRQAETSGFIDPFVSKEKFKETMPGGAKNEELYYNIISTALRKMDRTDLLALSSEIQSARQSRNRANPIINNRLRDNGTMIAFGDVIDSLTARSVISGSQDTAYGLYGDDLQKVLDKRKDRIIAAGGPQASNIHLNDISSILKRGIITYTYIMGSAYSAEGIPDHIKKNLTFAEDMSRKEQQRQDEITQKKTDAELRDKAAARRRQDERDAKIRNIDRAPDEYYVNGETDQGYIAQRMTEGRLRQRLSTDTIFDNPELERSERGTYDAGQRQLREEMARLSRDVNSRLDNGRVKGFLDKAKEYGKAPFELVENGLKLVDSFLFRILYGEDASDVMLDEHKLPSILDSVRINIKAQWLEAGNWFARNIGDPLKKSLFDSDEGIIPRIADRLNEKVVEPVKERARDYKNKLIGAREVGEDGKPIGDYKGGRFSDQLNRLRHRAEDLKSGSIRSAKSGAKGFLNKLMYGEYAGMDEDDEFIYRRGRKQRKLMYDEGYFDENGDWHEDTQVLGGVT
ncbi:MAG: hypothetical protein NC489_33785, partial [Ruminococcus flavefaciens]|nr:hypothetical protein [Ruminococcus flavefaciens]